MLDNKKKRFSVSKNRAYSVCGTFSGSEVRAIERFCAKNNIAKTKLVRDSILKAYPEALAVVETATKKPEAVGNSNS